MYEHTQRNRGMMALFGLAGIGMLAALSANPGWTHALGPRLTLGSAAVVMLASAAVFSSLTITVRDGLLAWSFGFGLLGKSVSLADVSGVERTTTTVIEGWGIHLTRRGWLYNVGGRGAVIVTRRDGSRFMLGTDEPDVLERAIEGARTAATRS